MKNLSKYLGCLIGGAVGDALGYAVEFLNIDEILKTYGEKGIQQYAATSDKALISDDTQMTLFTANGLLLGITRGRMRGISGPMEGYIYYAYLDWLFTQTGKSPQNYQYTWLRNVHKLNASRAPGNTCLSALSSGICGTIDKPINNSKGCGGVMRVAPIGLYFCERDDEAYVTELGAKAAAITHGHPLGFIPAATLVGIVYNCLRGGFGSLKEVIDHSIKFTKALFAHYPEAGYLIRLLEKAVGLTETETPDLSNIEQLGEGWVAEETLAIAIYCSLKYPDDFEKAVIASVNHSGDSDSTGAVTGNILGAWLGIEAIPQHFKDGLELTDVLEEIAKDLYNDCKMSEYSDYRDDVWESKYVHTTFTL
jgi:ADP-ribosylglycohydrolase